MLLLKKSGAAKKCRTILFLFLLFFCFFVTQNTGHLLLPTTTRLLMKIDMRRFSSMFCYFSLQRHANFNLLSVIRCIIFFFVKCESIFVAVINSVVFHTCSGFFCSNRSLMILFLYNFYCTVNARH